MSFIDSSTSVIIATLTRRGRQLLSNDSAKFVITQFAFGDDEINYQFYDGSSPDAANTIVTSIPVLEPASESKTGLRWGLATFPVGNISVADIQVPSVLHVIDPITQIPIPSIPFTIKTLYGNDPGYYVTLLPDQGNAYSLSKSGLVSSVPDNDPFNVFQNQTKLDLILITNIDAQPSNTTITVRGQNTGITKTILVSIN